MKQALGHLAWLTLAFAGGLIAVSAFERCAPDANILPCTIVFGYFLLLAVVGSCLTALFLGVTACRAAQQSHRWGWFGLFLSLTVLVDVGALTFFLGHFNALNPAFLRVLPLVAPPLALVAAAFVYRREEG
jgi:Na+/H+-dicarboxylate symporter